MRSSLAWLFASAALAACGTTTSPHYGMHPDGSSDGSSDALDAVVSPDVPLPIDVVITPRDVTDAHPGHGPPYPIVLHHGFAGFRNIGPIAYFYNVAQDLRSRGETVFEAEVSPFNPPDVRGVELQHYIDMVLATTGSAKVIIVGHSQGGLDARYLISTLGYGDRVALLATVATPHRGTQVADTVLNAAPGLSGPFVDAIAQLLGFAYNDVHSHADVQATLQGLSVAASVDFNRANPDDARVTYWSWAGRSNLRMGLEQCSGARFANDPSRVDSANVLLAPIAALLEQGDPLAHVNDGMVEVASAKWGLWMGCVPADHFDEVGQIANSGTDSAGWNHLDLYRQIAQLAHTSGF